MIKIIFLDIDGVLNTSRTIRETPKFYIPNKLSFNVFDSKCVERLNKITDATNAKLVISSTWRIGCARNGTFKYLVEHLAEQGVKAEVIGHTPLDRDCGYVSEKFPDGSRGRRGIEIQKWLDWHNEELGLQDEQAHKWGPVDEYIILDDSRDMEHLMHKLVWVAGGWFKDGLKNVHVLEAIMGLKFGNCWTCGKLGCQPLNHAGWHPDDDSIA